jgi:S-adenosylmethionine/arginine decarboxylase-like enzyme
VQNGQDFGRKVFLFNLSMRGEREPAEWQALILDICRLMQMHPAHESITCHYPVDGRGGVGFTIFQAITESFIVLDAWPDHQAAYLFICSCQQFDKQKVYDFLTLEHRFPVVEALESGMSL